MFLVLLEPNWQPITKSNCYCSVLYDPWQPTQLIFQGSQDYKSQLTVYWFYAIYIAWGLNIFCTDGIYLLLSFHIVAVLCWIMWSVPLQLWQSPTLVMWPPARASDAFGDSSSGMSSGSFFLEREREPLIYHTLFPEREREPNKLFS